MAGSSEEIIANLREIRNSVGKFEGFVPKLVIYLSDCCQRFKGGQVAGHFPAWTAITSDKEILSNVSGLKIDCDDTPTQHRLPSSKFLPHEYPIIDAEVKKLLHKGVIKHVHYEQGQVVSGIFLRPKKDGTYRLILNLKKFNDSVTYQHFKMDSIHTVTKLVTQNCFMAVLDLKDAYYSLPINKEDQKFLRFKWKGDLYQFTCLPNGLSCAPRKFTKTLKPALATLHTKGNIAVAHIDDCYLQGNTYSNCVTNVIDTTLLLDSLGFVVHPTKSRFIPSQEIVTLGFLINSVRMTIKLTAEKANDLKNVCTNLLVSKTLTIREVARVIGKIVASFPGVMHGPLYYRELDTDKTSALKQAKGNFDAQMLLSEGGINELKWWIRNVETAYQTLTREEPQHQITTDASLTGWGAEYKEVSTGGTWTHLETGNHINYLEMLALFLGLQTFAKEITNTHIRLMCDNTTAVSVINHMGTSHSIPCNKLAKQIWEWCLKRGLWISAAHIPGKDNLVADFESRRNQRESEWMLDKAALTDALHKLHFTPEIDLFASRTNKQFPKYASYRPDPQAFAIDAFSLHWSKLDFYAFPPFSVIPAVLCKIQNEGGHGVCVLPDWPTQGWYPKALQMMSQKPIRIKAYKNLLTLPSHPKDVHPLWNKLNLLVCLLSDRA